MENAEKNIIQRPVMTFEAFAEELKRRMEERYTECRVEIRHVTKRNARKLTGLHFLEKERRGNISPVIYLDDFYEDYCSGVGVGRICEDIAELWERNRTDAVFDTESFSVFEKVKNRICFRVVNAEMNREYLQTVPHRLLLDLAILYYIPFFLESTGEEKASITVTDQLAETWGVTEDDLYDLAARNTPLLMKSRTTTIQEMIEAAGRKMPRVGKPELYVSTSVSGTFGAAVMLYEGLLDSFAEEHGGDFYIIPCSLHELIFVSDFGQDKELLAETVREVNATELDAEDILSDHLYHYCAKKKQITIAV